MHVKTIIYRANILILSFSYVTGLSLLRDFCISVHERDSLVIILSCHVLIRFWNQGHIGSTRWVGQCSIYFYSLQECCFLFFVRLELLFPKLSERILWWSHTFLEREKGEEREREREIYPVFLVVFSGENAPALWLEAEFSVSLSNWALLKWLNEWNVKSLNPSLMYTVKTQVWAVGLSTRKSQLLLGSRGQGVWQKDGGQLSPSDKGVNSISASFLLVRPQASYQVYFSIYEIVMGFPGGPVVKNLPVMQETKVWSLGWEDPLEDGMATHSSLLAWETQWTEEPGRLPSTWLQRVGHDWSSIHNACEVGRMSQSLRQPSRNRW